MPDKHLDHSAGSPTFGDEVCQKYEHRFLTCSGRSEREVTTLRADTSAVWIFFVSDVSTECTTDDGTHGTESGTEEEPKACACQGVLGSRGGSRPSIQRSSASPILDSAVAGRAGLFAPVAVDAGRVEVVHPVRAAAGLWDRVLNLPRPPVARRGVVGVRELLRAQVAITGGSVVDRFKLFVAPSHLVLPGRVMRAGWSGIGSSGPGTPVDVDKTWNLSYSVNVDRVWPIPGPVNERVR